jgi:hypothetical protein
MLCHLLETCAACGLPEDILVPAGPPYGGRDVVGRNVPDVG